MDIPGLQDGTIKPWIIADIKDDRFVKKKKSRFVKMDNNTKLESETISIWNWDDDAGYKDSVDVTELYSFFEIIEYGNATKTMTISKLQESFRNDLEKGIKATIKIKNTTGIFFILKETNEGFYGVFLDKNQYKVLNERIQLSINPEDVENAYATYAFISHESTADNGLTMNQSRSYSLNTSLENPLKFPLTDLTHLALKALGRFLTTYDNALSFKLEEPQIKELIEATNLNLSEYAATTDSDISKILEDSEALKMVTQAINKMNPESFEIEKFLLRNEDFKNVCMKAVYEKVIAQNTDEINKLNTTITALNQEKTELDAKVLELNDTILKLEDKTKQISELELKIQELTEKKEIVEQLLTDKKQQYIQSVFADGLKSIINTTTSSRPLIYDKPVETESNPCEDEKEFIKNLKKNLSSCLESENSLLMLCHFIISALKTKMSIIVCNDPFDIISNSVSAASQGKLCPYTDVSNCQLKSLKDQIENNPSTIVRVDNCLEEINYKKLFFLTKHSEKHIIFSCNDKAILDAAPPELWNHSIIVDLRDMKVVSKVITNFSTFEIKEIVDISNENEWSFARILADKNIISQVQCSILTHLSSLSEVSDNYYIEQYAKQIALSNQKIVEFQKVTSNE